jgi:dipeptidyl aminopeptidase/acylaminoacyl peptidase
LALKLRKRALGAFLLFAGALAQSVCCQAVAAHLAPFTVQNSVEWTRILAAGPRRSGQPADKVLFSADHEHFLVHTRRGDVARNASVERIFVFDTRAVRSYLASQNASPPQGRILAEVAVRQDSNALSSITWLDSRRFAFLAEGVNEVPQVFIADLESGAARQVTSSKNGVASFAIAGDRLLFYAHRAEPDALVQAVGDRIIYSVIVPPAPGEQAVELFESSMSSAVVHRIDLPAARLSLQYRTVWIAPSGRYGVVLAPALTVPNHWTEYRAGAEESRYTAAAAAEPDSVAAMLSSKVRYVLVDLDRGEATPLLDAPSGSIAHTFGPTDVYWPDDERSVIVSHTYLPLTIKDRGERARRALGPAIAEIDLRSRVATAIAWEPQAGSLSGGDTTGRIRSVDWDRSRGTLHVQKQEKPGTISSQYFRKVSRRWTQVAAPDSSEPETPFTVEVRQSLNERPRLFVGGSAKAAKLLLDPNPAADGMAFGRVEVMSWTDENRLQWSGGLVYPVGYVAGQKYPLVLQTHGFRQDRFLLDGAAEDVGTAFAAQALANAGFLVLQASESRAAVTNDDREARLVAQGWHAGIRELIARGLVDPEKIGIVAFSRTCMHAIRFVADFPQIASAVTLADGAWWGYGNQLLLANYPQSALDEILGTTGGKPDPRHLQEWFDAQPLYKLADARAAIRIEAMGAGAVVAAWETFAVLQNAARPVDMIYFPQGDHNLMKPDERIGSQQGNVDWFRFWLKSEEDTDPQKAAQYQRWRRLRDRGGPGR